MTVLGEAFIEIKGDLKPFIRDLHKELEAATAGFDKRLKDSINNSFKGGKGQGEKLGDELGDGFDRKMRRRFGNKKNPPWVNIASAFASALDDGISALPTEVKAAIVFGIIAAVPIVSGALAGAISAAVGVGFAGLGSFIAFQYDEVRERGKALLNTLRLLFIDLASPFVPAMLRAMDTVEKRFDGWIPMFANIFSKAAAYIDPLTQGILDAVQGILNGVEQSLGDTDGFIAELGSSLRVLGSAIGETLRILASTGNSGREAFRDFIYLVAILLVQLAQVIKFFTEIYHVGRLIADIVSPAWALFAEGADHAAQANSILVTRNHEVQESTEGVIKLTDAETKRLKDLAKALKDASDATYDIIQTQVDFQRSLDHITESLDANGKTFDITQEKGRQNVEAFLKGLRDAQKETESQVALGKLSSQQAADYYRQQIAAVQKLASEAGITGKQFNTMFGDIIAVAQLKLDAAAMGITNTTDELTDSTNQARELYDQLNRIRAFRLPKQGTRGFSEFAEGGIVSQPTHALVGEAGPEAVIPLTRPARAAELLRMSGLDKMLGSSTPSIQVFVGNEQLDARTYRIVTGNNDAMANSLAFGARGL